MGELGEKLEQSRTEKAKEHLEAFKLRLTQFALNYRNRIQEDPIFREQFVAMCDSVGVDPIQISKANQSWLKSLVGIGDFYSELAVQVLTQCMLHRKSDFGSLLPVGSCLQAIQTKNVSVNDIHRALKSLDCFGSGGVRLVEMAGQLYISSIPDELSQDTEALLGAYKSNAGLTIDDLMETTGWRRERTTLAVDALIRDGAVWVDEHQGVSTYWVVTLWLKSLEVD